MAGTRDLVVATDAQFVVPTAVTLRSLYRQDGSGGIRTTILHDGVDPELRRRVEASLPAGSPAPRWVGVDVARLGPLPPSVLPAATWFRILALESLPPDVERFVYLDVDVLVRQPLDALWTMDLGGRPLGAVRSVNYPCIGTWGAFDHWRRYGLDPRLPFFNAGLLVVDVAEWVAADATARIIDVMGSGDLHGGDQQALNVVLAGQWTELDPVWNQQSPLLEDGRGGHLLYDDATIDRARASPAVIHFLDRPKPWHEDCTHPARELWRAEAESTAFAPITLDRRRVSEVLRWRVRRAASALIRGR